MARNEDDEEKVQPVSDEERQRVREALVAKYGPHLEPGETLTIDLERRREHCWGMVVLETSDDALRVEIEAAVVEQDLEDESLSLQRRFDAVLDLLDLQLHRFLSGERIERFHDDWRIYDLDGVTARFRGQVTKPSLDRLADAWLASHGDPGDEKPS